MRTFRLFRWILVPISIATLFFWGLFHTEEFCPAVEKGGVASIYSNQCRDDMRTVFLRAIEDAKESIHLVIYSFTDSKLLTALQKRADEGVQVVVIHDSTSSQRGFNKLHAPVVKEPIDAAGLMHQKILITDNERVWIGSTNWTNESLRVQKNLLIGVYCPELAKTIVTKHPHHYFSAGNQRLEFWASPEDKRPALSKLIDLIDNAEKSIYIGMFVWTHPSLTEAVMRAQKRGVKTEIVLDAKMAKHTSKKAIVAMRETDIDVRTFSGIGTFHHKFAWIDGKTLVNGSLNWTNSAFKKNWDCFLILHELTEAQQEKMEELWHIIRSTSRPVEIGLADKQHLSVLWERPQFVVNQILEPISIAA